MKQSKWVLYLAAFLLVSLIHCSSSFDPEPESHDNSGSAFADVTDVSINGSDGRYTFQVEISSPDTGCDQYADWWEVVTEDGDLIYRRILLHSHVDEQPFMRGGGPANISNDAIIWVRAHMNKNGYGGQVFYGSVNNGFEVMSHPDGFALQLENEEPLPGDCAF
jgi:hypothetical protein